MIDEKDREILKLLEKNARISNADIAKKIGMAPSAVLERVRKLERRGVIEGYETRINARVLGLGLSTIVRVKTSENVGSMNHGHELAALPEVRKVYCLAGEYSYLLEVCVQDTEAQIRFLAKIGKIKGLEDSETILILQTIKDSIAVDFHNC